MAAKPDFQSPPIVETVLGLQFDPLQNFSNAHLGAFWRSLGDSWTSVSDAPLLPQEFERFGKEQQWVRPGSLRFNLQSTPAARVQIRNAVNDRMIQLQNGRLHYNWLGHGGAKPYARYEAVCGEFLPLADRLSQFLVSHGVGSPRQNQWEVTYVNHLPMGTVWHTPDDWHKVFSQSMSMPTALPSGRLDGFSGEWHYEIEPERGRLHVELQLGREELDSGERRDVLVFKLTARGPIRDETGWDLASGLNIGHDTIVNGFVHLTTEEAQAVWKERR